MTTTVIGTNASSPSHNGRYQARTNRAESESDGDLFARLLHEQDSRNSTAHTDTGKNEKSEQTQHQPDKKGVSSKEAAEPEKNTASSHQDDDKKDEAVADLADDVADAIASSTDTDAALATLTDDLTDGTLDAEHMAEQLSQWLDDSEHQQQLTDDQLDALQQLIGWLNRSEPATPAADNVSSSEGDVLLAGGATAGSDKPSSVATVSNTTAIASESKTAPAAADDAVEATTAKARNGAAEQEVNSGLDPDRLKANDKLTELLQKLNQGQHGQLHKLPEKGKGETPLPTDPMQSADADKKMADGGAKPGADSQQQGSSAKSEANLQQNLLNRSADNNAQLTATATTNTASARGEGTLLSSAVNGGVNPPSTSAGLATQTASSTPASVQAEAALRLTSPQMANQLGQQLVMMVNKHQPEAEIRLDPPELGSMLVKVQVHHDQTNVSFQVQHAHARDAIESAIPRLREMLSQQGMNLGQADVSHRQANGGEQQFAGQQGNGSGEGQGQSGKDDDAVAEMQQKSEWISVETGRVDYYA